MSDRKEFQTARSAGKAIHQAQRLENATYTAAEVKALTKPATDLAYALGRKETAEEIATAIETHPFSGSYTPFRIAAAIAREIGTKEAP